MQVLIPFNCSAFLIELISSFFKGQHLATHSHYSMLPELATTFAFTVIIIEMTLIKEQMLLN